MLYVDKGRRRMATIKGGKVQNTDDQQKIIIKMLNLERNKQREKGQKQIMQRSLKATAKRNVFSSKSRQLTKEKETDYKQDQQVQRLGELQLWQRNRTVKEY